MILAITLRPKNNHDYDLIIEQESEETVMLTFKPALESMKDKEISLEIDLDDLKKALRKISTK